LRAPVAVIAKADIALHDIDQKNWSRPCFSIQPSFDSCRMRSGLTMRSRAARADVISWPRPAAPVSGPGGAFWPLARPDPPAELSPTSGAPMGAVGLPVTI
jgi:hypothetical protein